MFSECLKKLQNKKVIVCVSGGADSMVLLALVCKYKEEYGIVPVVCHFEHGIRGKASVCDMELVKKRCNFYGVPFLLRRENIPEISGGANIEAVARQRRYAYFYECLKTQNADCLVLAHHKDDNVETVLMNIIRGCGIGGLAGMESTDKICRPLLHFTKEQLYKYAREHNIPFNEDETNKDTAYLRNSIRHELLPLLKQKNPKADEAIERLRQTAAAENDFFTRYIESENRINKKEYGYDINAADFENAHKALKGRYIGYILKKLGVTDYSAAVFADIEALANKETGKKVIVSKDISVYKNGEVLSFVKKKPEPDREYIISLTEKTVTPFGIFIPKRVDSTLTEQLKDEDMLYVGKEALNTVLKVRCRREGDKIKTFGGHSKKLKDIFIDKKVPVFLRNSLPVVLAGEEIIWVPCVVRGGGLTMNNGAGFLIKYEKLNQTN
ncbi:MAG: tRNA lysidine(34) synthetase TilS [Clostridia bacterium]|nr:tRNA lysidine(34) synthetase TilS [Clostridia bacterium]